MLVAVCQLLTLFASLRIDFSFVLLDGCKRRVEEIDLFVQTLKEEWERDG